MCCRKYNDDTDLYIGKRPCRRSCRGCDTDSDEIVPVGTYLSAEKEDTIAEDSQTYAMILEKQANDENAVDENGKLITQEQSVTQQEMVKIPEAKSRHIHG